MKGSVSGYTSKHQTVIDNTTKLYAMPEGSLYWYGNKCTKITGGWDSEGCGGFPGLYSGYPAIYNTNDILLQTDGNNGHVFYTISQNAINLSKYIKFHLAFDSTMTDGGWVGFLPSKNHNSTYASFMFSNKGSQSDGIVDISTINESRYVYINANESSYQGYVKIKSIWLE